MTSTQVFDDIASKSRAPSTWSKQTGNKRLLMRNCKTVLMMASGVAVSAATSWLVGSVLILPAVLLLCATALVATWVISRHSVPERSSSDSFPSVVYSLLAQQATDVRRGSAAWAESGIPQQLDPEKPRQQSHRGYANAVSFME
ncbi:uncharacterized protein LOC119449657 isoform X2 [Dermacentor silvarum]|uniref:uncharacterized protein LOC119449657 isoform X2 n=1 Tax=Dermacentor silvarum TaxID=543639 RepID=UPI002100D0F7|nr:uncharacterized protein LOC119449657 isoform X2 [Dermacentor silvarum]XP_049523129.1 uncharacterized protein LOC119449657 isoform X2 [Dermacentor silvarum]